jgi:hypothetical protein
MELMRLPWLSYRSLLILYGVSVATLFPLAAVYAYAYQHGWNRGPVLVVCLALGIISALIVWSRLEPHLLARQPAKVNLDATPQRAVFVGVLAAGVAVSVFALPVVIRPPSPLKTRTAAFSTFSVNFGVVSGGVIPLQQGSAANPIVR